MKTLGDKFDKKLILNLLFIGYYHQLSDNDSAVKRQAIKDVHKSRHIHLKAKLAGFTNGMYHLLPPNQAVGFKFTKGNKRFYIIKSDDNTKEYKVQIVSAFIHLTRVQLTDKVNEQFMARWKRERVYLMPFCRGDVHSHVITPKVR